MALDIIKDPSIDKAKQPGGQTQTVASPTASTSTPPPASPVATASAPTTGAARQGTGYTNIQKVLGANVGNQLGQAVGGGITSKAQQTQQVVRIPVLQRPQPNKAASRASKTSEHAKTGSLQSSKASSPFSQMYLVHNIFTFRMRLLVCKCIRTARHFRNYKKVTACVCLEQNPLHEAKRESKRHNKAIL